jgi:hypothetical protein
VRLPLPLLILAVACGDPAGDDGPVDAAPVVVFDAAVPDAGPPDATPARLSETRLYADFAAKEIAPDMTPFTPAYVLWSDGADKRRWIRLPPGTAIDKTDPDHWRFPVGTEVYKEFSRGGVPLETRLIRRTGEGSEDYWMGSFVWLDDGSDAVYAPDGAENIRGTDHDAPSTTRCWSCHTGEPGRVLGFSAIQQGTAPGDDRTAAALGYLHANCGHCHSDTGIARPDTTQILRLSVAETTPQATRIYLTTVGVPLDRFHDDAATLRIAPGNPAASGIIVRMSARGDTKQMPPFATEHVDEAGTDLVRAWIASLPAP